MFQAALAKELGLCYAAIALATDYDCWRESDEPVSVEMVLKTFKENAAKAVSILLTAIPKLAVSDWKGVSEKAKVSPSAAFTYPWLPGYLAGRRSGGVTCPHHDSSPSSVSPSVHTFSSFYLSPSISLHHPSPVHLPLSPFLYLSLPSSTSLSLPLSLSPFLYLSPFLHLSLSLSVPPHPSASPSVPSFPVG